MLWRAEEPSTNRSGSPNSTYGAAGALIVLMFWVYCSAQIFLPAAELTKAIDDARNPAARKER